MEEAPRRLSGFIPGLGLAVGLPSAGVGRRPRRVRVGSVTSRRRGSEVASCHVGLGPVFPPKWVRFPPKLVFCMFSTFLIGSSMFLICTVSVVLMHSDVLYRCVYLVGAWSCIVMYRTCMPGAFMGSVGSVFNTCGCIDVSRY